MTDAEREALRERMDGNYKPPATAEPAGGQVPPWRPITDRMKTT